MRQGWRFGSIGAVSLLAVLALVSTAHAVEYRLYVVSVLDTAFASYLRSGEFRDGAAGPGLDRLEASFDSGGLPAGVLLGDRRAQPVPSGVARAYGGTPVAATFNPGGGGTGTSWDEISWDGKPGERSVWLVSPILRSVQELERVALKSKGPLRQFRVYTLPPDRAKIPAVAFPLNFLWALEERGTAWDKYLARGLDLQNGVGVVVGVNTNPLVPDQAYLVVSQAEEPTTYKAVLVWRERNVEREAPGNPKLFR